MPELVKAFNWGATALGPRETWSDSLSLAVDIILSSGFPMALRWGSDFVLIYNDGYKPILGEKHPSALGRPAQEVWPEVWDQIEPVQREILLGQRAAVFSEDVPLRINRRGTEWDDAHFTLSYSPTPDRTAPTGVGGIFITAVETTSAVQERRRADEERELLRFLDLLGRAVQNSNEPRDILAITTRMVGQHLKLAVCAYADMDHDQDGFTIRDDWAAPGSQSIVGHYSLADFGRLAVEKLSAGEPLILGDNRAELPPEEAAAFQSIGITSTICMPLVKDGRLTALMAIHDYEAREWRDSDLALIREVTERSWAHVERVASQAQLRARHEWSQTLARAMPNHVWTSRPDGFLDWFNDQVYLYAGADPGSLDGQNWAKLVHPDDVPRAVEAWTRALQSGEEYEVEFRLRRRDGAWRWHIARAVAVRDPRGAIVQWIGTNTDIQDQKEVAEALSELNATLETRVANEIVERGKAEEALRQSQKMEAIGQLTGGIAHDFNNLLGAISGSLSLLARRIEDGKPGAERFIEAGQQAVRRAAALTQRLLAFSRRQTLDPKPVDANRLVAGIAELVRRSVGPSVDLEVVEAAGLWLTKADVSQLENAVLNLCVNARDAMQPAGGRLTIETANKWLDQRAARERDLTPGQYISLCVSDTGSGMEPDIIARAFDPFFTTKPIGQGTGLGLSMVYGFVRQSGGQVRIYSEIGKGTTVCLYLPRFIGVVEAEREDAAEPNPDRGEGETVLVVDDEPTLRMLMTEELGENGYAVLTASDGPSGLAILQTDKRIDLLITDVGLPGGMNGRQVADAARAIRANLKVLFITGYAENAVVRNGLVEPGMEILTKPFEISALPARVRAMLDKTSGS